MNVIHAGRLAMLTRPYVVIVSRAGAHQGARGQTEGKGTDRQQVDILSVMPNTET